MISSQRSIASLKELNDKSSRQWVILWKASVSGSGERDLSLDSEGYIGKVDIPFIPTLLGVFILRQYYSKILRDHERLILSFLKEESN